MSSQPGSISGIGSGNTQARIEALVSALADRAAASSASRGPAPAALPVIAAITIRG